MRQPASGCRRGRAQAEEPWSCCRRLPGARCLVWPGREQPRPPPPRVVIGVTSEDLVRLDQFSGNKKPPWLLGGLGFLPGRLPPEWVHCLGSGRRSRSGQLVPEGLQRGCSSKEHVSMTERLASTTASRSMINVRSTSDNSPLLVHFIHVDPMQSGRF